MSESDISEIHDQPNQKTTPENKKAGPPEVISQIDTDTVADRKFSDGGDFAGMMGGKSQPAT